MTLKKKIFNNGLKLIYEKKIDSDISSVSIMVKLGSIYEPKKFYGLSHFLEHMVFKGTCGICRTCNRNIISRKNCLKNSKFISEQFDSVGADFNAYTDKNLTSYYVKSGSHFLHNSISILSDMILNTNFKKNEFHKEKKVVLEELSKAMDDSGPWSAELVDTLTFKKSSLGQLIGGYPKNVKNLKFADMVLLYENFYLPSNIAISIVSNKNFQQVVKYIENSYFIKNKWTESNFKIPKFFLPKKNIKNQEQINYLHCFKKRKQTYFTISFKTCDFNNKDQFILEIIGDLLAGNMSSRFFLNLREKNGLTYSCHTELSHYDFSGNFIINTSVENTKLINFIEKKTLKKGALNIIIDTLNDIKLNGFTPNELKKVKGYSKGQLSLINEDSVNICDYNGRNILFEKKYDAPLKKYYNKYHKNITLNDINRIFNKYFNKKNMNICLIGPSNSKRDILNILNNLK